MNYYDTFVTINKTPKEYYADQLQALVDSQFDNSSTVQIDIEEEKTFGSFDFQLIDARITSLIDIKTGKKVNDDMKKIIFKNINYQPKLGTRYRFSNNIWIAISTDNIKSATASVYIARCNSSINTQDEYGVIHQEPCVIDFNLMETKPEIKEKINTPSARIEIKCQYNDWTKNINIGNRYVFGQDAYILRDRVGFNRTETLNINSVGLLSYYADYNETAEDDNISLGISHYKNFNQVFNIVIQSNNIKNIIGSSSTLSAKVFKNNVEINEDVLWYSSDISVATINESTGVYTLNALGNCSLICKLKNNIDIVSNITIEVVSEIVDNYQDIITPNVTYLTMNQVQDYEIYEYNNNIKTSTPFVITAYDMPIKNYSLSVSANGFTVTNLKSSSDILLRIVCHNTRTQQDKTILIELGGMF